MLTSLDLGYNDLGEGGGRALAETLRLNSTLKSLNLGYNQLGEGAGRALAETLRLNTSLTSLKLMMMSFIFNNNDLREEVQSALAQSWGDRGGSLEL
jgi:Ran GTPase-activating protein (RanGAP) involved in mRNA processing and transport